MRNLSFSVLLLSLLALGCKRNDPAPAPDPKPDTTATAAPGYPIAIGQIIKQKCLSCHNADNAKYSGGLRLDTWDYLMAGGNVGPDIIPYHLENSVLLQYINTFDDLGLKLQPTMPIDGVPLTHDQVKLFQDWVKNGAPNKDGYVAFSSNPDTRQKIYLTMQSCDLLAVIDAETKIVMRVLSVGKTPAIEAPHCVRVDNAGRYAYVSFTAGDYVQKIDTRTDQIVGEINMRTARSNPAIPASWNVLTLSEDGKRFMISNFSPNGQVFIVNTETMTLEKEYVDPGAFQTPHASVANAAFDTFYVTAQYGNIVYKFSKDGSFFKKISIDGAAPTVVPSTRDPHEIILFPDGKSFAVTCQASNEVRFIDAHTDAILAAIPVGRYPQEVAVSSTKPWLFVTCMEDETTPVVAAKGSVYVINYQTRQLVKVIYGPFWQPHGITVDDQNGKVYVASRNVGSGIPPHHASACAGQNGFYNVLDLETLTLTRDTRYEVSVEPYSADVRFKR